MSHVNVNEGFYMIQNAGVPGTDNWLGEYASAMWGGFFRHQLDPNYTYFSPDEDSENIVLAENSPFIPEGEDEDWQPESSPFSIDSKYIWGAVAIIGIAIYFRYLR